MLVPLLGHVAIAYGIVGCFIATIVVVIWGLVRGSAWLIMTSSLLAMFVSVSQLPLVGVAGLPLPYLLFMLGFWRLTKGALVPRILLTVVVGLVYVVVSLFLVILLIR